MGAKTDEAHMQGRLRLLPSAQNSREVPKMSKRTEVKSKSIVDAGVLAPSLHMPDASSTAAIILSQAMEYCAHKMGLKSTQAAIDHVKQGDTMACSYCHYSAAQQVADALGMLDNNVQAAYLFEYDATPEDVCLGEAAGIIPLHLLVWVNRKTDALSALVESLDRAMAQSLAGMLGTSLDAYVLDVQVVDDSDVKNRTAYGALLSSLFQRPIKVWDRQE
jgi:hypothetical protein